MGARRSLPYRAAAEALAELQNISRTITTAINNDLISSGLRTSIRQSEPAAINGVFPSRGGGAGCQEVGVVLVDAIRNGNLQEVVSHCKNITLDPMKLAEVRLKATLAHEQIESRKDGLSIDERVAQRTQGEVENAKSRLSIAFGLERAEVR